MLQLKSDRFSVLTLLQPLNESSPLTVRLRYSWNCVWNCGELSWTLWKQSSFTNLKSSVCFLHSQALWIFIIILSREDMFALFIVWSKFSFFLFPAWQYFWSSVFCDLYSTTMHSLNIAESASHAAFGVKATKVHWYKQKPGSNSKFQLFEIFQ